MSSSFWCNDGRGLQRGILDQLNYLERRTYQSLGSIKLERSIPGCMHCLGVGQTRPSMCRVSLCLHLSPRQKSLFTNRRGDHYCLLLSPYSDAPTYTRYNDWFASVGIPHNGCLNLDRQPARSRNTIIQYSTIDNFAISFISPKIGQQPAR